MKIDWERPNAFNGPQSNWADWVALVDASDLDWKPGEWPGEFTLSFKGAPVEMVRGIMVRRKDESVSYVEYSSINLLKPGTARLFMRVVND